MGIDEAEVVFTAHITMKSFSVDEYQDIVVAQTAKLHLAAHIALVERQRGSQSG